MQLRSILTTIYNNNKALLMGIFLFSLLVLVVFLPFVRNIEPQRYNIPGTDYLYYYAPTAESLIAGKGVPFENEIGIRYPIGFPAFLAFIFSLARLLHIAKLELIVFFNIIISAASTCVLFLLAKTLVNKKIALISSFLWLTYSLNVWFIKKPNSEVPFILLFFVGLFLYVQSAKLMSRPQAFFAGIVFGAGALIRPIIIALPIIFTVLLFVLLKKQPFKKVLTLSILLLVGYSIVISPWIQYVYMNTGKLLPLSTIGRVAFKGGTQTLIIDKGEEFGSVLYLPKDVTRLIQKMDTADTSNSFKIMKFFGQSLLSQPIAFLKLIAIKMSRAWYARDSLYSENIILAIQIPYILSALLGMIVLWRKIKNNPAVKIFIVTILYFWALATIGPSLVRYMVPAMALMIIFSSFTLYIIFIKLRGRISKTN